jgi:hypothetical protein
MSNKDSKKDKNSPKKSGGSDDKGVKEATAALKGMLGIGGGDVAPATAPAAAAPSSGKNHKPKGKNKKKNKKSPPPTKKDENKSSANSNKKKNKGGNVKQNDSKYFAGSAFQSSAPDASHLPMPAFSPNPNLEETEKTNSTKETLQAAIDSQEVATAPSLAPPVDKNEDAVSKTGVNIAALSSSPKESPNMRPNNNDTNTINHAMMLSSPPPPHPPHAIPPHHFQSPPHMSHPQMPPHASQMIHPPHPLMPSPPPPGYMTMHVQVPYQQLGPQRQMIIFGDNGLPIQVTVPPGVPPGAIMPVHIPTMPQHMMPPPPPPQTMMPQHPQLHGGGNAMTYPQQQSHHPQPPTPPPPHHHQHHG